MTLIFRPSTSGHDMKDVLRVEQEEERPMKLDVKARRFGNLYERGDQDFVLM